MDVPSPAADALAAAARVNQVYLVIGVIERDFGTLYCTVLFLPPMEHSWASTASSWEPRWNGWCGVSGTAPTLPVIPTPLGRLGAVICWRITCRSCAWRCTQGDSALLRAHGG